MCVWILDFVCSLVAATDCLHNAGGAVAGAVACIVNGDGDAFHIQNVLLGAHSHDHRITGDGDLFFSLDCSDAAFFNGTDLGDELKSVIKNHVHTRPLTLKALGITSPHIAETEEPEEEDEE